MYTEKELEALAAAAAVLAEGLPGTDPEDGNVVGELRQLLTDTARRLHDNYPYHHPLYAGQMLKPPHPVARLAYALALSLNPNNHALDGGRASSAMEIEAVAASGMAHYTHQRLAGVLQIPFESVAADRNGRMDLDALEAHARRSNLGTVVVTLGTTGTGSVDPLPGILSLAQRYGFRVHVDAAYGGYFTLIDELEPDVRAAFDALDRADSIVLDPHKHGLQPYGCGCVLFRDPAVAGIYRHDSAYTYFTPGDLHLGEISLECSRAGAAAVALWTTLRLLPLERGGRFAQGLAASRRAAQALFGALGDDPANWRTLMTPDLDIVVWAPAGQSASSISRTAGRRFETAAELGLYLALMELPAELASSWWRDVTYDQASVTVLRSCLMKPEHERWLPAILDLLRASIDSPSAA